MKYSTIVTTVLTAVAMTAGLNVVTAPKAYATQNCDNNAIIYCGATSPADFAAKAHENKTGDLDEIYQNFGLAPAEYQKFATNAKMGTAYKDGRIVVDGRTVANNARSIGREHNGKPYKWNVDIANKRYYGSYSKDVFVGNSIPVMVLFNDKGVMQTAVLTSCANPITGDKVVPTYDCDTLTKTAVQGEANTYTFTAKGNAAMGAQIDSVTYDFGDGSKPVTMTNPTSPVKHTYAKPGEYIATVTVNVLLPGNQKSGVTSATCATTVSVAQPEQPQGKTPAEEPMKSQPAPEAEPEFTGKNAAELPKTGTGVDLAVFALVSTVAAATYSFVLRRQNA